jgi:hypothetical protein
MSLMNYAGPSYVNSWASNQGIFWGFFLEVYSMVGRDSSVLIFRGSISRHVPKKLKKLYAVRVIFDPYIKMEL